MLSHYNVELCYVCHSYYVSVNRDTKMSLQAGASAEPFDRPAIRETNSCHSVRCRRASLAACQTSEDDNCHQYVDSLDEGFR